MRRVAAMQWPSGVRSGDGFGQSIVRLWGVGGGGWRTARRVRHRKHQRVGRRFATPFFSNVTPPPGMAGVVVLTSPGRSSRRRTTTMGGQGGGRTEGVVGEVVVGSGSDCIPAQWDATVWSSGGIGLVAVFGKKSPALCIHSGASSGHFICRATRARSPGDYRAAPESSPSRHTAVRNSGDLRLIPGVVLLVFFYRGAEGRGNPTRKGLKSHFFVLTVPRK